MIVIVKGSVVGVIIAETIRQATIECFLYLRNVSAETKPKREITNSKIGNSNNSPVRKSVLLNTLM